MKPYSMDLRERVIAACDSGQQTKQVAKIFQVSPAWVRRLKWVIRQLGLNPTRLVFIDETWAKTNMTRLRGRAPIGERLVAKVPHGHWKTTTLIAALDHRGMRCSATIDGSINGNVFEA